MYASLNNSFLKLKTSKLSTKFQYFYFFELRKSEDTIVRFFNACAASNQLVVFEKFQICNFEFDAILHLKSLHEFGFKFRNSKKINLLYFTRHFLYIF